MSDTAIFYAYAANLVAQFADGYLTSQGLNHGLKEGNPVTRFLIGKLGLVGTNAIKIGAVPFATMLLEAYIFKTPGYLNGILAAVTVPIVVWNFILLKKNKISVKW